MDKQAIIAGLDAHNIPWQTWGAMEGTRPISKFISQIERKEAELLLGPHPKALELGPIATRKIRTALSRIYFDIASVRHTLIEYKETQQAHGERVFYARTNNEASISEKKLPDEDYERIIYRALQEEIGLKELTFEEYLWMQQNVTSRRKTNDFRESNSFPGTYTDNDLEAGFLLLPKQYYKPFYIERDDEGNINSIFTWRQFLHRGKPPRPFSFFNERELESLLPTLIA